MNPTGTPAFRLTTDCIRNSFRSSHKTHLILTGARKSGKSTLLSGLFSGNDSLHRHGFPPGNSSLPGHNRFPGDALPSGEGLLPGNNFLSGNDLPCGNAGSPCPGITTWAEPGKAVYLKENSTGETACIGVYDDTLPGTENKMRPCAEGFLTLGISALRRCGESAGKSVFIDEIGYLENHCPDYCSEIRKLMARKSLFAVVRKQSLPFTEELCRRNDVFLVDLDQPFGRLGCIIMASGLGRRFGGNKLMADFRGKPLLAWTLEATEGIFSRRLVVTRHREVEALCRSQGTDVLLHDLPDRSDTIRLGLAAISEEIEGCLFCPGDQPLLLWETVASLALNAVNEPEDIWRPAWENTEGAPVLFPKWSFPELQNLPQGLGGSFLLKKYAGRVRRVPVRHKYELHDIDNVHDLNALKER